jgi:hypothetical protein
MNTIGNFARKFWVHTQGPAATGGYNLGNLYTALGRPRGCPRTDAKAVEGGVIEVPADRLLVGLLHGQIVGRLTVLLLES